MKLSKQEKRGLKRTKFIYFKTVLNLMDFKNFKDRQTHKLLFHIIDQVNS